MVTIGIINANECILDKINLTINKTLFGTNFEYKICMYNNSFDFLDTYTKMHYDVLIVDTYLRDINTTQFLNEIQEGECLPYIIFTFTNKPNLEDFIGVNVFAFIAYDTLKVTLPRCISSCLKCLFNKATMLKIPGGYISLRESQIVYIEYVDRKVVCHTINNEFFIVRGTLKSLIKKINSQNLTYINRSVVINLSYVSGIYDGLILMKHCMDEFLLSKEKERMFKFLIENHMKVS